MKKIAVWLLLCLTMVSVQGYSQLPSPQEAILLLQKSQIALDSSEYTQALEYGKAALALLPESGADSLKMVANGMVGEALIQEGEAEKGINYYKKALEVSTSYFGVNNVQTGMINNSLGHGYYNLSSYKEALKYYEAAIKIYDKVLDPFDYRYAICYGNMAVAYDITKDHGKALLFFEKSLQLNIEIHGENHRLVGSDFNNLGMYYQNQGKYGLSVNYFRRALNILKRAFGNHKYIGWIYGNIGVGYKQQGLYDSAFIFYQKELDLYKQLPSHNSIDVSKTYNNIGSCLMELGRYSECNKYLNEGLRIRKNKLGVYNPRVALIYENLGISSALENKYDKAIYYFNKSANSLNCSNLLECSPDSVNSITSLLSVYGELSYVLKEKCLRDEDKDACLLSRKYYHRFFQILNKIKTGYDEYESKQLLSSEYFHVFGEYIDLCYRLDEKLSDPDFKDYAFRFSEKSKSFLLLEALQSTDAKKFAGIPDSLLKIEQELALDITDLEWEKFDLLEAKATEREILAVDSRIFDQKKAYHALLANYKSVYPTYFKMKYELPEVTVQALQDTILGDHQTLVEYFIGEENHFVFAINKDTFLIKRLTAEVDLKKSAKAYHRLIANFPQLLLQGDVKSDSLAYLGHQLYQEILAPIQEVCREELIIIPDGELAYLPFESLIMSEAATGSHFSQMDWLIRKHTISYCNSAALLMELKEEREVRMASKSILTVSPEFGDRVLPLALRSSALGALTHNLQEAEGINRLLGGDALSGDVATIDRFKTLAPQYRLLHLATHAVANDKAGDFSFLAFTPSEDSTQSSSLYAKNIYNLKLDADLVVLSACETGVGELKKGEGMISLARAFTYAGARSLLSSIWQVNDRKTADLMSQFYHYLKKRERKDIALKKAKLEMIKPEAGTSAHPFYWASFKAYGNMSAIKIEEESKGWGWTITGIVLLLISLWLFKRKRSLFIRSRGTG